MENRKNKIFSLIKKGKIKDILEASELLHSNQMGRIEDKELFPEGSYEININWQKLEKIAIKTTPFEWMNGKLASSSNQKIGFILFSLFIFLGCLMGAFFWLISQQDFTPGSLIGVVIAAALFVVIRRFYYNR